MVSVPYGRDAEVLPRGVHLFPDGAAVPAGHVDLEGQLAGERDPADPGRHAGGECGLAEGHEAERVVGHVEVRCDPGHDLPRLRADDRDGRPLLGDRGADHVEVGPLGLQPLLEPVEDARGAAGGGGHEVAVVGEPQGDAVVEHHPVRRAHHAVAGRADGQLLEPVGVDPVEELAGVRATDLDLAERGGVHHRDALACGPALAGDGGVHVLPGLRVVPRPQPLADDLDLGAVLDVPRVHRRGALGVEEVAALPSGQRRERDRAYGAR